MARLGVAAPLNFIKRQLAAQECTYLKKCCVDQRIIGQVNMTTFRLPTTFSFHSPFSQIESALEECIATGTYLDASTILPSIMSEEDIADIIAVVLKPNKQKSTQLFGTTSECNRAGEVTPTTFSSLCFSIYVAVYRQIDGTMPGYLRSECQTICGEWKLSEIHSRFAGRGW